MEVENCAMTNELGRLRHARRAAMLAVLFAGASAADRALRAQSPEELDSGTFDLLVDGRVVGTERFVVRHDGTSIRAAARVTLEPGADALVGGEIRLLLDADFRLNRYELKPEDGPLRSVVGIRQGNRLRLQTDSEEGERVKEFVAPPGLSVLERASLTTISCFCSSLATTSERPPYHLSCRRRGGSFERPCVRRERRASASGRERFPPAST